MIHRFANPTRFVRLADVIQPWTAGMTFLFFVTGLYFGLFASPADYQQGETVRIMYIHVPAAWMALFCYTAMAAACALAVGLVEPVGRHALVKVARLDEALPHQLTTLRSGRVHAAPAQIGVQQAAVGE